LNTAYSNVVNPLFLANPELAGVMSTASQLKCAYSRPRLRNTPPLPANAIDVQIPEQYRNVKVAGREEVPFLLVDLSYPTVANGIVDGRILGFCKNQFIPIICAFEYRRSIFNLSANLLSVFHNPYIHNHNSHPNPNRLGLGLFKGYIYTLRQIYIFVLKFIYFLLRH
jgi:hypothetical protein